MHLIEQHSDLFSYEQNLNIYNSILKRNFIYGERDREDTMPLGMVSNLAKDDPLLFLLETKVKKIKNVPKKLVRAYINLILPGERPFFHEDGDVITCLFYFCPNTDFDEGGETQFYLNGEIKGIRPIPGSLVCFDGNLLHKATSFRTLPRITVALKYILS